MMVILYFDYVPYLLLLYNRLYVPYLLLLILRNDKNILLFFVPIRYLGQASLPKTLTKLHSFSTYVFS